MVGTIEAGDRSAARYQIPQLAASGVALDMSPDAFGELRRSDDLFGDYAALQERLAEDGYLFLPGYLNRNEVIEARREIVARLAKSGHLDPAYDPFDTVAGARKTYFMPELALGNAPLLNLLYSGRMMDFYRGLLGGEVRHYDYTWMRTVGPGAATAPHCDIVYMGRGTTNVYTAWTPLGDVTWDVGGLMVLEKSHLNGRLKNTYGRKDVDAWCTNRREKYEGMGQGGNIGRSGKLTDNPASIRKRLGGRWLSAEFQMGDLLTFTMYTVHGSLDNDSNRVRLSSDTRYQLASEPIDERWIGEHPIGHGEKAARGVIC